MTDINFDNLTLNHLVLYCRAGFEKECAAEISDRAAAVGVAGYAKAKPQQGYVLYISYESDGAARLLKLLDFDELIFVREWFAAVEPLAELPVDDRLSTLIPVAELMGPVQQVSVEYLDTNEGKSLSKLCKKITPPLEQSLKKRKLLQRRAKQQLHILFLDGSNALVGVRPINKGAIWPMGVSRLRLPKAAPSRATLKLEEAIHWYLRGDDLPILMKANTLAVDLGAAPGGWTWQLVQKGLYVDAVDNGPMDKALMDTGMVAHVRGDAFTYQPARSASWLVCDIADKPARVASLIARWVVKGWCKRAIFNLKLPMKQRYLAVLECKELIETTLAEAGLSAELRFKQLYHDREEVTAYLSLHESGSVR